MPQVIIPFETKNNESGEHEHHGSQEGLYECGLFRILPPATQDACRRNAHLMEYMHYIPIEEVGIPQYYPELSKKLGDLKQRNLFYPVSDNITIHVWSAVGETRDLYIPVEPCLGVTLNGKMSQVETRLLDYIDMISDAETREEREQALISAVNEICVVLIPNAREAKRTRGLFGKKQDERIPVTIREFEAIKYLVLRDKAGMGVLEPFAQDPYLEDISCSGLGNIFLEHRIFDSMKSAVCFDTHEELDLFVLRLSEQIKKPVTMRNPIVDATLLDGSRINIVYGKEVSQRGSNFTIRKFSETPISIMQLIEWGTLSYHMAAYLSIVLEDGMNTFVAGETASGKTTLVNAITVFVPPTAKVISIEDTPEIQVPHPNWIREVSKPFRQGEQGGAVSMFDLLKAALRQRPNLIIIGEIRGEEGAIAFQAMQTGHAVMSTFHAASVEKLIQRLTGDPINVPKAYIDNLNIVVLQSAVKLPNGKIARRTTSINEIVAYNPATQSFSIAEIFRWDPVTDTFEFVGERASYILEEKIAPMRGLSGLQKMSIYALLEKRANILRKLHQDRGITGYYELLKVLARAQREGLF